jgi:16S rRNA (cytosine1402-N4)-methyltransferase
MNGEHIPVLLAEVLKLLVPRPGDVVLDGTVGGGGHARAMLDCVLPGGRLIGLDRDEEALRRAAPVLAAREGQCELQHGDFAEFDAALDRLGVARVDVALLDLGVSSFQFGDAERGFSFQQDGPLDMRMDPGAGPTAAERVNRLSERELADLFWTYGQERHSRRIAARIVRERKTRPIETTGQLARLILGAQPRSRRGQWQRIHPATRVFQALRICVNDELESLETFCRKIAGRLSEGGRVAVISFHSLEDRIVKRSFRARARDGVFELVTRKPVTPGAEERRRNPRSRSAKLRVARRSGAADTADADISTGA